MCWKVNLRICVIGIYLKVWAHLCWLLMHILLPWTSLTSINQLINLKVLNEMVSCYLCYLMSTDNKALTYFLLSYWNVCAVIHVIVMDLLQLKIDLNGYLYYSIQTANDPAVTNTLTNREYSCLVCEEALSSFTIPVLCMLFMRRYAYE